MPRIQCPLCTLVLMILVIYWIAPTRSECYYEGERHEEGIEVPTAEPCLNCTCGKGVLLCYLRVCPRLPDPPPPGCVLLHRHRTCCAQLICTDIPAGNRLVEARNEPSNIIDYDTLPPNRSLVEDGCISNGSVYGPGSAMASSSLCEYCYCLGGKQHCVKPRCLLPLDGCIPAYEDHSCCPIHYNCTPPTTTTSSTTSTPRLTLNRGGCTVDGKHYREGGKVLGVGHSVCDNCYCIRGLLRCEPLACAPNLLGCTPVIKPGECCAASYNCSGVIEVQYLNYGHYPTVSKDYAKLRKEVQRIRPIFQSRWGHKEPITEDTGQPFYVIAETAEARTTKESRAFATTRHFTGTFNPSTNTPYYYFNTNTNSHPENRQDESAKVLQKAKPVPELLIDFRRRPTSTETRRNGTYFPTAYSATTNYQFQNQNYRRPYTGTTGKPQPVYLTTVEPEIVLNGRPRDSNLKDEDYGSIFRILDSLLDGRNNRRIDTNGAPEQNVTAEETTQNFQELTTEYTDSTTFEPTTSESVQETTEYLSSETSTNDLISTTFLPTTEEIVTTTEYAETRKDDIENATISAELTTSVTNSTDCIEESSHILAAEERFSLDNLLDDLLQIATTTPVPEEESTLETETSTFVTTEHETATETVGVEVNSTATIATVSKSRPDIEAIINITKNNEKQNEDYVDDYDYNVPSLPPSLPNLRIIPFVAADAVLAKNKGAQEKSRPTDSTLFGFTNLFQPPIETEGGFLPRDPPPIMNNFYENNYHTTTGINIDITSSSPIPPITNPTKTKKENCITEGREIEHGDLVSPEGACVVCMCFYGTVVCQQPHCPPPGPGCHRTPSPDLQACCPHLVCDNEEAPTVVLDRMDVTVTPQEIVTVADGVSTSDPFRDVIHTQPAPDLQSLIGDIMPYLVRQGTTSPTPFAANATLAPSDNATSNVAAHNATRFPEIDRKEDKDIKAEQGQQDEGETDEGGFTLNKVFELLFSSDAITEKSTSGKPTFVSTSIAPSASESRIEEEQEDEDEATDDRLGTSSHELPPSVLHNIVISESGQDTHPNSVDSPSAVGLLKLAGCNIYGRMYRVGRIISELSGPCLECKCTEVGVQCRPLSC